MGLGVPQGRGLDLGLELTGDPQGREALWNLGVGPTVPSGRQTLKTAESASDFRQMVQKYYFELLQEHNLDVLVKIPFLQKVPGWARGTLKG